MKKQIEEIGTVSLASKEKIEATKVAYDALTDAQKALVPAESLKVLTDAETECKKLSEGANNPSDSEKISITKAQISTISDQIYSGKAIVPSITVAYNGKSLVKDSDYTVSCKNNINIGTATITITGKGDYNGEVTKNFVITVKKNTVYTVGNYKYMIASANTNGKGTVAIRGIKNASVKKKLKKINIKSAKLKSMGKNAIKGISAKATISCPKKQKAKYKKLFKSSVGFKKTMKIK